MNWVQVRTDLVDSHMYIFNREALMHLLIIRPTFTSIKQVTQTPSAQRYKFPLQMHLQGGTFGIRADILLGSTSKEYRRPDMHIVLRSSHLVSTQPQPLRKKHISFPNGSKVRVLSQEVIPYMVSHQHVAPAPALESIDSELSVDSATRASHNQPDEGSSLSDGRETANAADYTGAAIYHA